MNSILMSLLLIAATPPVEVQTLDGATLVGPLTGLDADRLTIEPATGPVSIDADRLLSITTQQKSATADAGVLVTMIDGSAVAAKQYTVEGPKAKMVLSDDSVVETPVSTIDSVRLQHSSDPMAADWLRLLEQKSESDLLVVRNEHGIDYHRGVLHDVANDTVRFDLEGEVLPVKRAKIFGLIYRHGESSELPATVCRVTDASGSQWSAASLQLADPAGHALFQWTTPTGIERSVAPEQLVQVDFSGGKIVYLSDLKAEDVHWTPYFSVGKTPASVEQFFAPRFDRGFESPALELGGVTYKKGLAMHSRTEIVYRLPDRFARFRAVAGIADAIRPGGNVRLVIQGDGRDLFDATIGGSDAPQPIDLDVSGVRRLTVIVGFGDRLSMGDYLLLCNARLNK